MKLDESRAADEVASGGRILGWLLESPGKPHQRDMLTFLAERKTDDPLRYARATTVILLPRQVGKTAGIFAALLARTAQRPGYSAAYTAQTGTVVTHVMSNPDNGWLTLIESRPRLSRRWRTARSQGREVITHRTNTGAYIKGFPPSPGRLRSNALDCVVMDECQEHSHTIGGQLLADTGPVFTTKPRRQLVLIGTAGERGSWWHDQTERARQRGALLEIGTFPDDADATNPNVWRAHHPGLRSGLTDVDHLTAQLETLGADLFAREYGNRWIGSTSGASDAIADSVWHSAMTGEHPGTAPLLLAVDIAADSRAATFLAAARDTSGALIVGVTEYRAGSSWVLPRLSELRAEYPRLPIVALKGGPAAPVIAAANSERLTITEVAADNAMAQYLVNAMETGKTKCIPHPAMEAAREAAVKTFTESGQWKWSRRRALGDISPLMAWTVAVWYAKNPVTRPRVILAHS